MAAISSRSGVTLVELVVAMAVTAIVTGAAYGLYGYFMKTITHSSRFTASEQGAYQKLEMLSSTLRRSFSVVSIENHKVALQTNPGDTLTLAFRNDTLYRSDSSNIETPWFTLDTLAFTTPESDSGWITCKITVGYPGQSKEVHFIDRDVVIFQEKSIIREDDWGFWN